MGGVDNGNLTITNYGVIKPLNYTDNKYHFGSTTLALQNYLITINENPSAFNAFSGSAGDDSHLVLKNSTKVSFADAASKLILDFGDKFEFGAGYLFSKLVVGESGNNALNVDLSRLMPKSDIYLITQSGDKFVVHFAPQYGAIGSLYKSNIRTMNNFYTISNSMIFPRKYSKSQNLGRKQNNLVILSDSEESKKKQNRDSALISFIQNDTFFYQSESQNLQTRRIQRQNKRNYSRTKRNDNLVILSDSEESKKKQNRDSSPLAQNDNYYFILTPFVNHNYFFESGRYNLSGFDYGFLTAFSGKIAESNSLGAHFVFSYGSLNDKHDKDLSIISMNFMLGVNYKLDLVYDMFFKARGDIFYFSNALDSATIKNIKPNNLGFGVSVSYGKDFDFKQGGVLGIEGGLDYKALNASKITLDSMSETYEKSLYNVLYVDLGISYAKYFGNFGINANLGIKGNVTANKLAKSQIYINTFNKSVDMVLDNDKVLGYVNVALSYVLNARNFDMEFSLAYYGNFGDRVISNGGGFEWRTTW